MVFNKDWGIGPKYSLEFDSASPEFGAVVQLPVMITASDKAGNNDGLGASIMLYLDTAAPNVTLDPPNVRERREKSAGVYECSHIFDPLGAAHSDLSPTFEMGLLRAMVWEHSNSVLGQTIWHYAGTDDGSVYVYLQPDPQVPLLIDSNDDGYCDALDTAALDESRSFVRLAPIPVAGASSFTKTGTDADEYPSLVLAGCSFGSGENPPDKLCHEGSDLSRVVGQKIWTETSSTWAPVVYGVGPIEGAACTGADWELGALAPEDQEGWICLAARAEDNAGNVGVSRPLRLCLDRTDTDHPETPACVVDNAPDDAPTCMDGCAIPDWFDYNEAPVIDL